MNLFIRDVKMPDNCHDGEWIHVTGGKQKCSVCKSIFYNTDEDVFWYFCPHCGSHMTYGLLQNPD